MNQFYVCWQRSLKVKAVSPKHNSDKMLYFWMNFQKLFDQNPKSDFFRVWTSFMFVDTGLTYYLNIHLEKKQFLCQICNSAWNWCFHFEGVYQRHDFKKYILIWNSFCVRFVTKLQISRISIKASKEWTLIFSLWGCLSETWF